MAMAIDKAREGIADGQSAFGAVIVAKGVVVTGTHNTVWRDLDPTAYAELNCIRSAARALGCISLSGCEMYSTCKPRPMCLSASHWSKIDRIAFGATIADGAAAGFCELDADAALLARIGGQPAQGEKRVADAGMRGAICALA
jgi:tRNA(Arg) A34 adenosine deaminase TadA